MREEDILHRCIEQLNRLPNVEVVLEERVPTLITGRDGKYQHRTDAEVKIKTPKGEWRCVLEAIKYPTTAAARNAYNMPFFYEKRHPNHATGEREWVLCADYINETVTQELRGENINYIDVAGNMYLNFFGGLYILIKGMRRQVEFGKEPRRLFQPTALKVILTLLLDLNMVNKPYREIAEAAGVALGGVGWIFRDLRELGFIELVGLRENRLLNKEELFDRWVKGYAEKLRPKLLRGRFIPKEKDLEGVLKTAREVFRNRQTRWLVTGGFAADMLVHYYRGEDLVLHVEDWRPELVRDLGWLPHENGPITILDGFGRLMYEEKKLEGFPLAPALMVYAELLNMGGERARETARLIGQEYLKGIIDER